MEHRVSNSQLNELLDYLKAHPVLIKHGQGPREKEKVDNEWKQVAVRLNAHPVGARKTFIRWKRYWADLKHKSKVRFIQKWRESKSKGSTILENMCEIDMKILAIIGGTAAFGNSLQQFPLDENEPPSKVSKQDNFSIIRKCCVSLVRDLGRPVALIDDQPFRDIINLVPLSASDRQRITADYIQKIIDNDEIDSDTDMETTADRAADDQDDDDVPLQQVKGEIETVICNCGKDSDDTVEAHAATCPAAAPAAVPSPQTYWNYFEVSMDEATCALCRKTITWNTISKLKEHLQKHHPTVIFLDDDEEFEKGPPSSVGSREEMEQVYLEDNPFDVNILKSTSKKRKKAKQQLLGERPITRENIALSLDRFKSLDSFGNYVAALMKLIPKDKCIKFQIQIVERLLQEQAAAA